MQDKK
jgi:hypothetical protein